MDDHKIIDLIRSGGNSKALKALYRSFPLMQKMIRTNGGSWQDAEDIFQEALIILCTQVREKDLQLTAKLSTYLYSICRYLWKDELKKRKAQPRAAFDTGLTQAEEQALELVREADKQTSLAEKVLLELGERCRELLLLFYHGGRKLKDIAACMGYSSENTAKNQKYKCLEAARNRLKELKQSLQTI
jgi:RNA polymerase sigma factor (sigma-70 family)